MSEPTTERDPYEPDDLVGEYDVRSPLARTIITVVGSLVVLGLIGVAIIAVSYTTTSERTETTTIDVADLSSLRVTAGIADVEVRRADGPELEVSARISEGLLETDYVLDRSDDGSVVIRSSCHSRIVPDCGVRVTLAVPEGLPVELRTSSGDIDLVALGGIVAARSADGDITGTDLVAVDLDLATGSGDIEASFAEQPQGVKARATSGDVGVRIPDGATGYTVSTVTESGDVESDLADDPDGGGFLTLATTSGDIELTRP